MPWNALNRRTRLELTALAILVAGLGLAVLIDRTAGEQSAPVLGYESLGGGVPQPVNPEDSRQYLRNLEQYNGKTGVMLYELRTWFAGLWQGRTLARTVFCLAVAAAAAALYVSRRTPPRSGPGRDEDDRRD
ncbi:hypothetical protein [Fundidesulfovibrio terrae]|uniref:hypothetical protein n=1 Tax=Fundidesulfovibrio terrae TaxID=2922866 RepID=UPI001FAF59D7|nr:hypothetical protein [Fundidesulfovibrio terrae]